MEEIIKERMELALERLSQIREEKNVDPAYLDYFRRTAARIERLAEEYAYVEAGSLYTASLEELEKRNADLYAYQLPENYGTNYINPTYAVEKLGRDHGQMLSFLAAEMEGLIAYAYEQDAEAFVMRLELFLEIYHAFAYAKNESGGIPRAAELKEMLYWFASDYSETILEKRAREMFDWTRNWALPIVMERDLNDPRYLYYYGEYITENERKMASYLAALPEEKINLMADTYSEGFRIGFEVTGKDLSKKKSVNVRYFLGFERVVRRAVENFRAMGLEPMMSRSPASILEGRSLYKRGYAGATPNKQFEYDHEYDQAIYLDKKYVSHRLDNYRNALENVKDLAALLAGPAVIESFGEVPFEPESKEANLRLNEEQQKLAVSMMSRMGALINEYVKGEERSFTIIAFPVPEIGENFEEIFDGVVKLNTLDYKLYQGIQQTLIQELDKAEYVRILGKGDNRTDLKVMLHKLENPDKETNFENCVADVNIPVGEVFTSPVLAGTNGKLHVTKVYLNEYKYLNLEIDFEDGKIKDYTCTNFDDPEENKKFIRENVLRHHDTLPLGEFAIGTNTTAYVFAEKYDIGDKLPILIAEKMGPHFAVGDTCFSRQEELVTYNPDGKRMIAKENEVSALRHEDMSKAYLNCHTDITIPYDELGELTAVTADGEEIVIIRDGRFVLAGCEELNKAFLSD